MTIRNIRWPDDQEAILDHIRQAYGPDDYETLAVSYGSMPTFDPADCFVIDGEYEGEIAGHATIVPRQIQIGESVLPTAEISMLSVLERYHGRGLEHALLEVIHEHMTAREDVLGLTFGSPLLFEPWLYEYAVGLYLTSYESDIATDLAVRAGQWDPGHSYERRTAERLGTLNREIGVRRFYFSDLPAVQALYAAESMRGHYLIARDEAAWHWQLDHLARIGRNEPDDFLVAEVDNRLVAYARLVTQGQVNVFRDTQAAHFSVIEAAGDHADAVEVLLGEIARLAQAFNVDRIGLFVHPQSTFMQHALARGASLRHFTGAGLVRLHHLPLALYLLVPTLESRRLSSRFASRAYHLVIATEHDQADIDLGMGSDREVVELEAPSTSIVRLITGWHGIENLTTGYSERYTDLLRVLFPSRDPKIALADLM
jgi:GNAT superfamily N-acetyltransferase